MFDYLCKPTDKVSKTVTKLKAGVSTYGGNESSVHLRPPPPLQLKTNIYHKKDIISISPIICLHLKLSEREESVCMPYSPRVEQTGRHAGPEKREDCFLVHTSHLANYSQTYPRYTAVFINPFLTPCSFRKTRGGRQQCA
jgi:hypothetical protein